jgi:hypothetical protein
MKDRSRDGYDGYNIKKDVKKQGVRVRELYSTS